MSDRGQDESYLCSIQTFDNTPGIFSPPFTVIATICAGGNTYVMSSFASDGLRLGRASAMVDQPSGESPKPCKNITAHLSLEDNFASSSAVAFLSAPEPITSAVCAVLKTVETVRVREDMIRETLFVTKAAAIKAHSIINRITMSGRRVVGSHCLLGRGEHAMDLCDVRDRSSISGRLLLWMEDGLWIALGDGDGGW